jgi:hypothetical protein
VLVDETEEGLWPFDEKTRNKQESTVQWIEKVHPVLGHMLRTFEIRKYPLDSFLLAAYAITRSTYPKVLEESRAEVAIGVMESERNLEQECGCGCLS